MGIPESVWGLPELIPNRGVPESLWGSFQFGDQQIRLVIFSAGPVIRRLVSFHHLLPNLVASRRRYSLVASSAAPPSDRVALSAARRPRDVIASTVITSRCAVRCSSYALVTLSAHRRHSHHDPLLATTALVAPSTARSRRPTASTTTSSLQ